MRDVLDAARSAAGHRVPPLLIHGQHWHVTEERGRLVYQDETGLLDLPPPRLIGAHQFDNAGIALAGRRALGLGGAACEAP